jgi:hypothetical protein
MRSISVAVGLLGICSATASAQEPSPKAGVGMAFIVASPAGQLAGFLNLFVPLTLSAHFRLEPQVGYRSSAFREVTSDPASPTNNTTGSSRVFLLGVGLLGTRRPGGGSTVIYYGPRVGLAWMHDDVTDPSGNSLTETQTAWYLTGVVGGEHLFSHLSLGGEVGLGYLHYGTPNWSQTGAGFVAADSKGHVLGTNATALLRWYFGS